MVIEVAKRCGNNFWSIGTSVITSWCCRQLLRIPTDLFLIRWSLRIEDKPQGMILAFRYIRVSIWWHLLCFRSSKPRLTWSAQSRPGPGVLAWSYRNRASGTNKSLHCICFESTFQRSQWRYEKNPNEKKYYIWKVLKVSLTLGRTWPSKTYSNHFVHSRVLYAPRLQQAVRITLNPTFNFRTVLIRTFLIRSFLVVSSKGSDAAYSFFQSVSFIFIFWLPSALVEDQRWGIHLIIERS